MDLLDKIRKAVWQCEDRHKSRIDNESKSPVDRYPEVYRLALAASAILKCLPYEAFVFIPTATSTPCYVTENGGANLSLKECYELSTYTSLVQSAKNLAQLCQPVISAVESVRISSLKYDSYARSKNEDSNIVWRIIDYTLGLKIQRAKLLLVGLDLPDYLRAVVDRLHDAPEGYLLVVLSEEQISDGVLQEIALKMQDAYLSLLTKGESEVRVARAAARFGPSLKVYVGGNYTNIAVLRKISDVVTDCGHQPLLAYDQGVAPSDVSDADLRMVAECKLAIFEVSIPGGGDLMEILRSSDYNNHTLLIYQIRDESDKKMPQHITSMLTTLKRDRIERQGYSRIEELEKIVRSWLNRTATK